MMQPLEKLLRNILEKTVKEARETAETAARIALEQLGVGEPSAYSHLSDEERKLRRKLRAHGRQLGNGRDSKGHQALDRLIEEVAYEHWHRMLFARFLAENNLLMYPDPVDPVPVTLEECEDLAPVEGAANGWELAARYASRMLPQIFRYDSPVFKLILPPEHQQRLESLVANLPIEVFAASDSIGWVYQFWQAKKKDEINDSEVKVGARELPTVTQLFTEPYMVSFLLDNSLGAWWAAQRLSEADIKNAKSEEELLSKAAIPGLPLEYLRFIKLNGGSWTTVAGTFENWPTQLSKLRTIDPCCGSGHFLVAAFLMLVPMRMELEGLSAQDSVESVLRENIHGLEIDQRCVELAAFALALSAWKYPQAGGYRKLPELNVACAGFAISANKDEWLAISGGDKNLSMSLEEIYKQFIDAPILGSLINPKYSLNKESLFELKWEEVEPLLTKALEGEKDEEKTEMGVVVKGITKAAKLLSSDYELLFTNPPYLVRGKQTSKLQEYLTSYYGYGDADLSTVFLKRFDDFLVPGGTHCSVTPLNWNFIKSYKDLRKDLLYHSRIDHIARIGSGLSAKASWDVLRSLCIITKEKANYEYTITGIETSASDELTRSLEIKRNQVHRATNNQLRGTQDCRFVLNVDRDKEPLKKHARSFAGLQSGDFPRYGRKYWELCLPDSQWKYCQSTIKYSQFYSGLEQVIFWEDGRGSLVKNPSARIQGLDAHYKKGVAVTQTRQLPAAIYIGQFFDNNTAVMIPHKNSNLPALWCYCSSNVYPTEVRKFDEKLGVTNLTLAEVPFDCEFWDKFSKKEYSDGLPNPFSNDPTQWIFHGHPCASVIWDKECKRTIKSNTRYDGYVLHVTVARLLGYRWPAELDEDMELAEEQRELVNRCESLLSFADDDGIVCIPPVRGEQSAIDRLLNLLAAAYGGEWSGDIMAKLLKSVDHGGKTLETWLRDKFFTQHCKLFQHRPFIWHIWDGLRDGFTVLVNYHKLNHKNLETLIYTYLGDWINRQTEDVANGVDGAQEKLAAAESLKKKLELILEGEAPHDIFIRWKPLQKQPIGWNPDLNDGVRLNIRSFMTVGDVKKKGAGVLRDKPNIKWSKDRGKDVSSAPWYHLFKGDRINDHHLTIEEKLKAREQAN